MYDQETKRIFTAKVGALGLLASFFLFLTEPALATPYAGTCAPLIAARDVSPDGDPENPFSYPFLRDLARSIAKHMLRSEFPASFFLGIDSKAAPGIDLRTMLLNETGIIKSPVRLFAGRKKRESDFPSLSLGAIPESDGKMPGDSGLKVATQKNENNLSLGLKPEPEQKLESPALNLDFNRFKIDLSKSTLNNELTKELSSKTSLAMSLPLSLDKPKKYESSSFRFWTIPAAAAQPKEKEKRSEEFTGSFVMMSPTGLKAVEGRIFFLNKGHILAASRGKSIVVETAAARVYVEPGATAFVEIVKAGLTRVRVLETEKSEHAVGVKFSSSGKAEEIRLKSGDDLLVAEKPLEDSDKSVQNKGTSGSSDSGENWNKTVFSAKQLLESNEFFSTEAANQDPEQRQTVLSLKKRLK